MADELSAPLLRKRDRAAAKRAQAPAKKRLELPLARLAFGVIALIGIGVVARIALVDDPNGGRPSAEVPITNPVVADPVPTGGATISADPETAVPLAGGPSFTTLDDSLPGGADAEGAAIESAALDTGLTEPTDDGPIPRIAADGTTPFAAYARAAPAANGKPVIAIIVTGLGLNEAGTLSAIAKLPDAVTLAFAPYGATLESTVGAARDQGHELLLQVPLEPFDYPDNDPGPDTLLTGQQPRENLTRLFWLMSRFTGYVGLINHMGARFTASGSDFAPVMEELGSRGLGYLDDGSSNRSLAAQLAAKSKVPFSRADMPLDDNPAPGPILAALEALEAKATANGSAIGVISALPVSIDTIVEWARDVESRGFVLVPASALMKVGS